MTASSPAWKGYPGRGVSAHLDHVSAGYAGKRVLHDVSLSLWAGQIYVLMGPNGSGKSTLVRLLTGTMQPEAGTVRLDAGEDRKAARPPVSLVPQDIALYPWLTARENCQVFARYAGASRREAAVRASRALALTACEDVASMPTARLSGGYKRRINIAAALVNQPELLILDEPSAGVDLSARRAITETLKVLRDLGTAILLITHDFDDAEALASRAGFLRDGVLVAEGAPGDLTARVYGQSKRIEILLGAPPRPDQMQVLRAQQAIPAAQPDTWLMFRTVEQWDARAVLAGLEAKGLVIKELRLRDPGLEQLYSHFCEEPAI